MHDDPHIPVAPKRAMPTSMLSTGVEDLYAAPRTLDLHVLSGELPGDLLGHVFIAGSIAAPGRPAFSGEGVMSRIDLLPDPARARLTQAVLRPPCFYADQALLDSDHSSLLTFHDLGLTRLSPILGVRTVLSNSPIALHDRMIVTTDAGRPWEFDPATLELITPIGWSDEWRGAIPAPWLFPLVLASAHPAEDPRTGEFFTANYCNPMLANRSFCHLIRWRKHRGDLEHFQLIDDDGELVSIDQCIHQIVVTKNHIILQDSAFVVEMRQLVTEAADMLLPGMSELFGEGMMRAQRPTTILYLVPRSALDAGPGGSIDDPTHIRALRIEIPGESVHFFAQYDDDDRLTLIIPHTPTLDVSEWVHAGELMVDGSHAGSELAGMQVPCALTQGTIGVHTIDPRTGELLDARLARGEETWGLALGTQAPVGLDRPIERVFFNTSGFAPELVPQRVLKTYADRVDSALMPVKSGRPPRLLAFEVATGKLVSYVCPPGWSLLSPTYVPRQGHEGASDGYLLCLAHAADTVPRPADTSGEEIWIFDARDITAGPICRLGHRALDFAFTVHSVWTPKLPTSRRDYRIPAAEDLDLDTLTHRAFGQISFWSTFSHAISSAMQHHVISQILSDDVLPYFDHEAPPRPATTSDPQPE
ncbi:MAG: carotenoid oxygenase family protein [Myxococcales bacterium]|nr:carotenoid oxygenase family protein [Myxococcales bacterium]